MEKKDLLYLAISSLILTIVWIASNVYHAYATSTIDDVLSAQITPITPDFDMETITKLRERVQIMPDMNSVQPTAIPTPTAIVPEETIAPEESPTPSIQAEQQVEIEILPTEIPIESQP